MIYAAPNQRLQDDRKRAMLVCTLTSFGDAWSRSVVQIHKPRETAMRELFRVATVLLLLWSSPVTAEPFRIQLGWGNLPDCTRMVASGRSLFGSGFQDTLQRGEQRVFAYLEGNAINASQVMNHLQQCAARAVAVATIAAVLGSPAAATPGFAATFIPCAQERIEGSVNISLRTETQCLWDGEAPPRPAPSGPPLVR